jgi:hypothetical protein
MAVAEIIADKLEELKLQYPVVDEMKRKELDAARQTLEGEDVKD